MSDPMSPGAFARGAPSNRPRSSLARVISRSPMSAPDIWTLRRRAWRETGVVVLSPEEIPDALARQALINAANALFGPRPQPSPKPSSSGEEKP